MKKEKSITRTTTNKENQPPEMSRVELSEAAKIDDIHTKCIVTSSKLDQGQLGSTIGMGDSKSGCQQPEIPVVHQVFEICPRGNNKRIIIIFLCS